MLAICPLESTPRVVHLCPAELGAILAELDRDEDFPSPVADRCALCHGPLTAGEADGTGVAHAECALNELCDVSELDFDTAFGDDDERFAGRVESLERTYG